ncbi:TlpA family protein disulfide reductase [Arachidicoccus terrestris]|uniref:TlpA family protein disulfide reductase n=1 Tax=Arachidicoccus terrestris TaxID=2875539 RepID=UPI001CC378BF|nr:TlpA disulfide reductase family protein [Arachidicoccus terrestris]UAY56703.1 TlpA family protein disulfide reductase [Arachidicoccus terrestris]
MSKKCVQLRYAAIWMGVLLCFMCTCANAQSGSGNVKNIKVDGTVEFIDPSVVNKVILSRVQMSGKPLPVDSVVIDEGHKTFHFDLKQDHPGIYSITTTYWDHCEFWSDADVSVAMRGFDTAKVHVKIPHYNFVKGSMDNNFINFSNQISQLNYLRMIDEYNEGYYAKQHKDKDSAWASYLSKTKRYDSLSKDYEQRMDVLMQAYADRPVTIYRLRGMTGTENKDEYDEAMIKLDRLIERYPWLSEAKQAKNTIIENRKQAEKVAAGQPLPEATYLDVDGKNHDLKAYKGHYLLIDFWASWCGPCRQAIPKVKELYNAYHGKGFDVVSISIDKDNNAWKKAMKEEQMPWQQYISPNMDTTMKQFQFSGIPTMYLISPEGTIIEKFTGYSPEAEAAIKKILSEGKSGHKKVIKAMSF